MIEQSETTSAISEMSREEAHEHVNEIKTHVSSMRRLLLALDERKGWAALGYDSMHKCLQCEFRDARVSANYLYRELRAARVEKVLLPMGKSIGDIPERQLRPITKLPVEQWSSAWNEVNTTAQSKRITAKHVEDTVKRLIYKQQTATVTPELFIIGDWVEVRKNSESKYWGQQGEVKAVDTRRVVVHLYSGVRETFSPSQLEKVERVTVDMTAPSPFGFFQKGELVLIDVPMSSNASDRIHNGKWGIIRCKTQNAWEVKVSGTRKIYKTEDLEPMEGVSDTFRGSAYKIQKLLAYPKLDALERRILELFLHDQVFTEKHLHFLNQIWTSYPAGELALVDGADEEERD